MDHGIRGTFPHHLLFQPHVGQLLHQMVVLQEDWAWEGIVRGSAGWRKQNPAQCTSQMLG